MNAPQRNSNPNNDRVKRDYLVWLKEAKQRSEATADQARHAIDRYEAYTGFKDFGTFNKEQALGFKTSLVESLAQRSEQPLSISTVHHILRAIRDFLGWLHGLETFRRRIKIGDVSYLNLSTGDERRARTSPPKLYPSLEEYRLALLAMPVGTEVERRDQAIMALLLLTCMRDAAVVGLKLRDFDLGRRYVFQNPRHANTKFSKPIDTFFFPVGDDVVGIVERWHEYLVGHKDFGPDDPMFPKTIVQPTADLAFAAHGIGREHWANAAPVRKCFRAAFARVGLAYSKPHSVRDTLTQLGYKLGLNAEEMKAWSQNMGHDKPLTTFNSYGHVTRERQGEIITGLGHKPSHGSATDLSVGQMAEILSAKLKEQGL